VIQISQCSSPACSLETDIDEEVSFFKEYFWYFIIASGILVAISILLEIFTNLVLLSQILALVSVSLSSYEVIKEAIEDIRNKRITANLLMLIAAVASFIILHGQEGALAILLYAIAEHIEEITTEKSKTAIKELLELAPDEALLKTDGGFEPVPSKEIKKGSIIGIKPAMKVPLDGVIIKGESYFDESHITGESLPIFKTKGDEIHAASINSDSFIELEVIREQGDSIVAQIAENVRLAFNNKSKSEKFIQKFARYYTPIILISAILVMIVPSFFFGQEFNEWFYRGLVLLVVSCPCALTLSTPLANIAALTKLAREGIYVKGNQYLEAINHVKVIAFDKTGTLTEGNLKVIEIKPYDGQRTEASPRTPEPAENGTAVLSFAHHRASTRLRRARRPDGHRHQHGLLHAPERAHLRSERSLSALCA